ncbi:citrate synthase [Pelomonas saccharophila]|uniref:Citrate synthase n=1 Tax=Roseateles saccharophilus TaxID=304 RepID=A0ABU1YU21_ROSSA|nr:citryl-CoA lyase [Roseateles saccharophilus]MDR7272369.1 citrate synthase [Roseateles saccharophilus]
MTPSLTTRIWREEAEPDNAFAARAAFCHGYDVYGEMLGQAGWVEMLFLLFTGEPPWPEQTQLLEMLAVTLANPGPRDPSVQAAMASGTGGAPAAATLMAALSVGAGRQGGARDVFDAMRGWVDCGTDLAAWQARLADGGPGPLEIWPAAERAAGFDPHAPRVPGIVLQALERLAAQPLAQRLRWLAEHREALEAAAGLPLAMSSVAAAALADLGFSPDQGEMLHLLLRLPGAAAHALEQRALGYKRFPFPPVELQDDPALRAVAA